MSAGLLSNVKSIWQERKKKMRETSVKQNEENGWGIRDKKGETFNKTAESINQSWRIDIGGKKCVLTKCTEINKKKNFWENFYKGKSGLFWLFFRKRRVLIQNDGRKKHTSSKKMRRGWLSRKIKWWVLEKNKWVANLRGKEYTYMYM